MKRTRVLFFSALLAAVAYFALSYHRSNAAQPFEGRVVRSMYAPGSNKTVIVVKNWYLHPSIKSSVAEDFAYPMSKANRIVEQTLRDWVQSGFATRFYTDLCLQDTSLEDVDLNGWTYAGMKEASRGEGFAELVAFSPMKMAVELEGKIDVRCAEADFAVRRYARAAANARQAFHQVLSESPISYSVAAQKFSAIRRALAAAALARGIEVTRAALRDPQLTNVILISETLVEGVEKALRDAQVTYKIVEPDGYNPVASNLINLFDAGVASTLSRLK